MMVHNCPTFADFMILWSPNSSIDVKVSFSQFGSGNKLFKDWRGKVSGRVKMGLLLRVADYCDGHQHEECGGRVGKVTKLLQGASNSDLAAMVFPVCLTLAELKMTKMYLIGRSRSPWMLTTSCVSYRRVNSERTRGIPKVGQPKSKKNNTGRSEFFFFFSERLLRASDL